MGAVPLADGKTKQTVKIQLNFNEIVDMDAKMQTLTSIGVTTMLWQDDFLIWEPEEY